MQLVLDDLMIEMRTEDSGAVTLRTQTGETIWYISRLDARLAERDYGSLHEGVLRAIGEEVEELERDEPLSEYAPGTLGHKWHMHRQTILRLANNLQQVEVRR